MSENKKWSLIPISIIIGILIALSPVILTGSGYSITKIVGNLLVAEFIVRTLAIIIGLFVIYDGFKNAITPKR